MNEGITVSRDGENIVMKINDPQKDKSCSVTMPQKMAIQLAATLLHNVYFNE